MKFTAIRASVSPDTINRVGKLFNNTLEDVMGELVRAAPVRLAQPLERQRHRHGGRMIETLIPPAERIARLNDRVRQGLGRSARTVITRGILAEFCDDDIPSAIVAQAEIMRAVRLHDFAKDAHGERDFGKLSFRGRDLFFKIDYYDLSLDYGSEDPSDASQTTRVLTIMLAEEY